MSTIADTSCLPDPFAYQVDGAAPVESCEGGSSIGANPLAAGSGHLTPEMLVASPRAAWGYDLPLPSGLTLADLVPSDSMLVRGPAQPNADYEALVVESPYVAAAGSPARSADAVNAPLVKKILLSEFLTEYVGEVRSYTFNVRGGAGLDEGLTLNALFAWILAQRSPSPMKVIVRARNPLDPIHLNRIVTCYASNVDIEFRSPVVFGPAGSLRLFGDQPELLRPPKIFKAKLASDAMEGDTVLNLSANDTANVMQAADFFVGDTIVLRGENDANGKALTKQTVHVIAKDDGANTLTVEALEYDFLKVYPGSDWPPDLTTGTTIALAAFAKFTSTQTPGTVVASVDTAQLSTSGISIGSVVLISTDEAEDDLNIHAHSSTPRATSTTSLAIGTGSKVFTVIIAGGDDIDDFSVGHYIRAYNTADETKWMAGIVTAINAGALTVTINVSTTNGSGTLNDWTLNKPYRNTARLEIKKIIAVGADTAGSTPVVFDSPLVDTYSTARFGGITLYAPVTNSTLRMVKASFTADQNDRNTHALQIGIGYKSFLIDCQVDGGGGQRGNGIRISNSLECEAINCRVSNPKNFASGEGYGFAVYYSDRCRVLNSTAEGCRHGFLLQKANHTDVAGCLNLNDRVSGFDVHGVNSINSHFQGCRGIGGPLKADDGDHKSIFRVGNTSHAVGDFGTMISGCFASGALIPGALPSTDPILTYAALEVFGRSSDFSMTGSFITDCDIAIRGGYDNLSTAEPDAVLNGTFSGNKLTRVTDISDFKTGSTVEVSFGGGGGGILQRVDGPVSSTEFPDTVGGVDKTIPANSNAPDIAKGVEVLSVNYTATEAGKLVNLRMVFPTVATDMGSRSAICHIFVGSTGVASSILRLPNSGGTSGSFMICEGTFVATGSAQTISVRFGARSGDGTVKLTISNSFSDAGCPFLLIEEH